MSWFNPTMPYTAGNKLLGGQIVQAPTNQGGPNTSLQYQWMFQNFSTVYPNWILPQMKNWKRRGANAIAMICGLDGVMNGTYTYAYWKACLTTMLTDCRALGLLFHFDAFENGAYSNSGTFTAAQWFAPTQSLLTDLLIPNQDIVCSMEAGMGEGTGAGNLTLTLAIAALAKAATTIPILISVAADAGSGFDCSAVASSAADIISINHFGNTNLQGLIDDLKLTGQTSGTKALAVTSFALNTSDYQVKADFEANFFQSWFGHPDVCAMFSWGGQGISPDGNFSLFNIPGNTFDPAADWSDTPASIMYASQSPLNRNWGGSLTATGTPTINAAAANIPLTALTKSVSAPTVANINLATHIKAACNLSLIGTITITGNTGSQCTLSFIANDGSSNHVIGTPLVLNGAQSGVAINMTGVLSGAGDWTFTLQGQRTSGATDSTVTALALALNVGSVPAFPVPASTSILGTLSLRGIAAAAGYKLLRDNPTLSRRGLILPGGGR